MKYAFLLFLYFLLNFLLFFINSWIVLEIYCLVTLLLFIISKIKMKKYGKFILKSLFFILFILICNMLMNNIITSLQISLKLFIALNLTYLMSNNLRVENLVTGFYYLLYPLKILKVDIKNLSMIITISLAFIPILSEEAKNIKLSLLSKGFKFNLTNIFTKPHIFLITYLNNLFNKIDEIEKSLMMKGF